MNKTKLIIPSLFVAILIVAVVGGGWWFLNRPNPSFSINPGGSAKYSTYEECFGGEDTIVKYGEKYGEPAICTTPDGQAFTEPLELASQRYQTDVNAFGPVESWEVYKNDEYGFEFRYPKQRYRIITDVKYWNRSVVAIQNLKNADTVYDAAIEIPDYPEQAQQRYGSVAVAKIIQSLKGPLTFVQLQREDPFVPKMMATFQAL